MKMVFSLILALFFGAGLQAVNASTKRHSSDAFHSEPIKTLTGKASWYGGKWIGRKTANGEIYRGETMTAAHKSLPFGTFVKVTNMKNGSSTIVRINNRGPYIKGRIIDLSVAAAKDLNMVKSGVVPVRVEVLEPREDGTKPEQKQALVAMRPVAQMGPLENVQIRGSDFLSPREGATPELPQELIDRYSRQ